MKITITDDNGEVLDMIVFSNKTLSDTPEAIDELKTEVAESLEHELRFIYERASKTTRPAKQRAARARR